MVQYRRNRIEGATYFFTVTLRDRRSSLLTERIDELRLAYAQAQREKPFETVAIAILPDHLHAVWTLPGSDSDYSARWKMIKGGFSQMLSKAGVITRRTGKPGYDLWQSRFWEHTIRDEEDLRRHVDYVHYNRSSMAALRRSRTGHIPHFTGSWSVGTWRLIGAVIIPNQSGSRLESDPRIALRSIRATLSALGSA